MRPKPVVGQTLYSLNVGNMARNCEQVLTPVFVRKVDNKYFSCAQTMDQTYGLTQYHIDDWREKTEYSTDSKLYETRKKWEEEKERNAIVSKLRKLFDPFSCTYNLSLDALRQIDNIINSAQKS